MILEDVAANPLAKMPSANVETLLKKVALDENSSAWELAMASMTLGNANPSFLVAAAGW